MKSTRDNTMKELLLKAMQEQQLTKKELKKLRIQQHNEQFYKELEQKNKFVVAVCEFIGLAQALRESIDDLPERCMLDYAKMREIVEKFNKELIKNDIVLYGDMQRKKEINAYDNVMLLVQNIRLLVKSFFFLEATEMQELSNIIKEFLKKLKILDKNDNIDYKSRFLTTKR